VQRKLLEAIRDELASLPEDRRPSVVIYGESLGAWAGQDTFLHQGVQGLQDLGVERALWVGTPYYSGWRREVLVDRTIAPGDGEVLEVEGPEALLALGPDERDRLRAVLIGHGNDPVRYISLGLIVRKPPWLGDERTWGVPRKMRWLPAITTIQVIVDAVNATRPTPGVFRATGHDYSADLPDSTLVAYGIAHPPRQVWERLVEHLQKVDEARASHRRRKKKPVPESGSQPSGGRHGKRRRGRRS